MVIGCLLDSSLMILFSHHWIDLVLQLIFLAPVIDSYCASVIQEEKIVCLEKKGMGRMGRRSMCCLHTSRYEKGEVISSTIAST